MIPKQRLPALRPTALALGVAVACSCACAEDLPFPPIQAKICTAQVIDKEKLAEYLLRKYPVSLLALSKVRGAPALSQHEILAQLLAVNNLCKEGCGPSDQVYLRNIDGNLTHLLIGSSRPGFDPTASVDPSIYLRGRNDENAIRCVLDSQGTPIEAPGAKMAKTPPSSLPLRVRGKPDHLDVDRSKKQEFGATDKAVINVANNHITASKTTKMLGYVGYSLPKDLGNGNWTEFVPYVGLARTIVEAEKPTRSSVASAGFLSSTYLLSVSEGSVFGHQFNVRPDFLADHEDGTRLFTLNLEYIPVKNTVVNDFHPLFAQAIWAKWILSLKAGGGKYFERGNGPAADSHVSFFRLGGKTGVAVSSGDPTVPVDFVAAFTSLGAVSGHRNVNYFTSSLTYNFDANKYFGLSLVYSRGNREDTGKKENQWEIGLSGRF